MTECCQDRCHRLRASDSFPVLLATDVNPSDKYKDVIATDSTQLPAVSGMGYKGLSYSTITVKILLLSLIHI